MSPITPPPRATTVVRRSWRAASRPSKISCRVSQFLWASPSGRITEITEYAARLRLRRSRYSGATGTWEIAETPQGRLACVNTARANQLVEEALRAGVITELNGFTALKREVPYGQEKSRIDFRLDYPHGA